MKISHRDIKVLIKIENINLKIFIQVLLGTRRYTKWPIFML